MISIELYLYAYLRRYRPEAALGQPVRVEVEEHTTVAGMLARLGVPRDTRHVVFVNGVVQHADPELRAGDRVGVFPPIAGGRGAIGGGAGRTRVVWRRRPSRDGGPA